MTGDLHMAWYTDCVFDEDHFPALGGERHPEECQEIEWNATQTQSLDPCTSESKLEVRRIIHLQSLANEQPTVNAPERVQVPPKGYQIYCLP
jgi:hypothetical protein